MLKETRERRKRLVKSGRDVWLGKLDEASDGQGIPNSRYFWHQSVMAKGS
jgi:hypothetical protein